MKQENLTRSWENLLQHLSQNCPAGLAMAFSGGVDSAILAKAALAAGISPLLAVYFALPMSPKGEKENAQAVSEELDLPLTIENLDPLSLPAVQQNLRDRCYHCKRLLFGRLKEIAQENGIFTLAEGSQADDLICFRPGMKAGAELYVLHPLADVGLGKAEIRALAREFGLSVAERPSSPCLATRFPYDTPLSPALLAKADAGEEILHELGFSHCRLRIHQDLCRIQVPENLLGHLTAYRDNLLPALQKLGFRYITCDLEGLTHGSFD